MKELVDLVRNRKQDSSLLLVFASSTHNMATGEFAEDLCFLFGQIWY